MKFMELWVGIDSQEDKEDFCAELAKQIPCIIGAIPHERKSTLIMLYFKTKDYDFDKMNREIIKQCKFNDAYFMQLGETRRHFP